MAVIDTDHPRVDAIADLYVSVTDTDVREGVPLDHCNCAVAHAIKRAVGTPEARAVIYPSVAYVLMRADSSTTRARMNHNTGAHAGELAWHRFHLPAELTEQIVEFDERGTTDGGMFRFRAPKQSQTLRAKRERMNDTDHKNHGKRHVSVRMPWVRNRDRIASVLREQEAEIQER